MKVSQAAPDAPKRATDPFGPSQGALSRRDSPLPIIAWLLALCSPLAFVGGLDQLEPAWGTQLQWLGRVGVLALIALVLRLLLTGYAGFERSVGLRIIMNRAPDRRWVRRFRVSAGSSLAALAFLLVSNEWVVPTAASLTEGGGSSLVRLLALLVVATGTLASLLCLLIQRFSVFGTASIVGVVLGVAALFVVQSVATGFQHEFERRVLGVYAHVNVTRQNGIAEYNLFQKWLKQLPGVEGASPFAYYYMGLAPKDTTGSGAGATVLVKAIDPETAGQTIDLPAHLEREMGRAVPLNALIPQFQPHPSPKGKPAELPGVIQAMMESESLENESPTGNAAAKTVRPDSAEPAIRAGSKRMQGSAAGGVGTSGTAGQKQMAVGDDSDSDSDSDSWVADDDWVDPPMPGERVELGQLDRERLPTMFIGTTLAKELGLKIDDIVRLVDPGSDAGASREPDFQYYVVAGIFQAGFQEYDSRLVYVHLHELQRFRFGGQDVVSGIDLRLADASQAPAVGREIRANLGPRYTVLEWQKLNENLFSSIQTQKNVITILLGLVICVACFNVWCALWTMVVRRTAEVAILMSMGATGSQVARIFQVTGMTIGLAGSLAGIGFGLVMCWLVELYGYTLDPEVYFIEELPVEISLSQIVWILGLSLTFCFIATIPPSLQAARIRPVEGLSHE